MLRFRDVQDVLPRRARDSGVPRARAGPRAHTGAGRAWAAGHAWRRARRRASLLTVKPIVVFCIAVTRRESSALWCVCPPSSSSPEASQSIARWFGRLGFAPRSWSWLRRLRKSGRGTKRTRRTAQRVLPDGPAGIARGSSEPTRDQVGLRCARSRYSGQATVHPDLAAAHLQDAPRPARRSASDCGRRSAALRPTATPSPRPL